MAMLFSQCGKFLYVGNFGDGTISIYDSQCGTFLGQFLDCYENILYIDGLWGLAQECNGDIIFAAGIDDETNGLVGRLTSCCEKSSSSCKKSSSSSSDKCCKRRC